MYFLNNWEKLTQDQWVLISISIHTKSMSGKVSSCNPIQRNSEMLLIGAVEENRNPLRGKSQPHPLNTPTCINYHMYCYFVITVVFIWLMSAVIQLSAAERRFLHFPYVIKCCSNATISFYFLFTLSFLVQLNSIYAHVRFFMSSNGLQT